MAQDQLESALRSLVSEHGFDQVKQSLHEIGNTDLQLELGRCGKNPLAATVAKQSRKSRAKLTAPEYVAKMDLPSGKLSLIGELGARFHDKSFLPTFGDIANFCHAHQMDVPASKTRANAVPRVFRCLSRMEDDDLRRIIDDEMFSGPSRLGPISDAIRRNGRGRTNVNTGDHQ